MASCVVTGHHWAPRARCAAVLRDSRAVISRNWCQGAPTPASLPPSPNAEAPPLRIPLQKRAQKLPSSPSPLVSFASPVLKCLGIMVPVEPSPHPDPKSPQLQRFSEPPTHYVGVFRVTDSERTSPLLISGVPGLTGILMSPAMGWGGLTRIKRQLSPFARPTYGEAGRAKLP